MATVTKLVNSSLELLTVFSSLSHFSTIQVKSFYYNSGYSHYAIFYTQILIILAKFSVDGYRQIVAFSLWPEAPTFYRKKVLFGKVILKLQNLSLVIQIKVYLNLKKYIFNTTFFTKTNVILNKLEQVLILKFCSHIIHFKNN